MAGLLAPVIKETYLGRAEVRNTFRVKGVGHDRGLLGAGRHHEARRGCSRAARQRGDLHRQVISLRRFKDDANEVRAGFECGVGISNFNDVKVGDILECFKIEKSSPLEAPCSPDRGRAGKRAEARRN